VKTTTPLLLLVVLLVALGFGGDPAPADAAPFRCTATKTITLPSHEAVAAYAAGGEGLGQSGYALAFPQNCQNKLKIGTYVIDLVLNVSLRLSSGVGANRDGARIEFSTGIVRAAEAAWIESFWWYGQTPFPYFAQADNSDFSVEPAFDPATCYPTGCFKSSRVIGTYSFATLDNVLAVYAVTTNCVRGSGLPEATPCHYENAEDVYLPGLESAQLTLFATATITPLYEVRR
jgi:hypothetical protein